MPPEVEQQQNAGVVLMADLVKGLVIANENAKVMQEMMGALIEAEQEKISLLDDLNGHLEALAQAANEVAELSQDKSKITIVDFCQALAKAEADVFSDDGAPE